MAETWRQRSRRFIQKIIDDNPGANETELRRLVSKGFPGERRSGHIYKSWLQATHDLFDKGPPPTTESVRNMWIK